MDLMCGSGTLLIEGAWMAADRAPAMEHSDLGLLRWSGHDPRLWDGLIKEARERYRQGLEKLPRIIGYDVDPVAVRATRVNLRGAGLSKRIDVETRALAAGPGPAAESPPAGGGAGGRVCPGFRPKWATGPLASYCIDCGEHEAKCTAGLGLMRV